VITRIWPCLSSTQQLFRVHRNDSSRNPKTGKPKLKTFFVRANEVGLSVYLSKEAALLCGLDVAGICTVTAGQVYSFDLALIRDTKDHAEIRPVPQRTDDERRALDIADYLVRVAEDVPI
jgi:hypothetical protein